jgi:hypothetical protein
MRARLSSRDGSHYRSSEHNMLDVRPVTADPRTGELPPKTRFMARIVDTLGEGEGFFHPNLAVTFDDAGPGQRNRFGVAQRGCQFVGECDICCNVGAKNSLEHNYLAVAERRGASAGPALPASYWRAPLWYASRRYRRGLVGRARVTLGRGADRRSFRERSLAVAICKPTPAQGDLAWPPRL